MSARPCTRSRIPVALLRLWQELGIDAAVVEARRLPIHSDASRLQPVGLGTDGRDKLLIPAAARAWQAMRDAAAADGVPLLLVSAFRSIDFQAALIRAKRERGDGIDAILAVNAPPGCSEHHTGRAVDIGSAGTPALDEVFETTAAFDWLTRRASEFDFVMSYPRGNAEGYLYEPWHWCWIAPRRRRNTR